MPYSYNRKAVLSIATSANAAPLMRAYCGLVLVELALKEELGTFLHGHNIPKMLSMLGNQKTNLTSTLNQFRSELTNKLSAICACDTDGGCSAIKSHSYPSLRYMRHEDDWPTDSSDDSKIDELRKCVDKIRNFLRINARLSLPL